jgi:Ca2+-binding EF-hand superfamily protein
MGDKLSDEQVQQMMGEALSSEEGNLNYKDFVHMMMNR